MDMAWFRDLSITLLGLVTSCVLIFGAALGYRLYREAKMVLETVKLTSKTARETVTAASEAVRLKQQNCILTGTRTWRC